MSDNAAFVLGLLIVSLPIILVAAALAISEWRGKKR